jgi:hypothetical protein
MIDYKMNAKFVLIIIIASFINANCQQRVDTLLFDLINQHRLEIGVGELEWSDKLYDLGKLQTDYHYNIFNDSIVPDERKLHHVQHDTFELDDRAISKNIKFDAIGENLLYFNVLGMSDEEVAEKAFDLWFTSNIYSEGDMILNHKEMMEVDVWNYGSITSVIIDKMTLCYFNFYKMSFECLVIENEVMVFVFTASVSTDSRDQSNF